MSEIGLYEAMSTTRAVRRLRPDPLPEGALAKILRAATWAATGGNVQPWRVVVVEDPAKKSRLQELYAPEWSRYREAYAGRLDGMPEAARAKAERTLAAGDHLAANLGRVPVILVFCFDPGRMAITDAGLDRPSIVGGASVYTAVENALLAARAEGVGCVLTTLLCFREAEVRELLGVADGWYTAAAVPLGLPVGGGHGKLTRRAPEQMAFQDVWGEPWRER
ncbi:MAG: nitroreductase family protein [Thermoanaerobaculia bacterium]|nr:nitroreductase family protein [Thermoanaerobaculia bacterium]